LDRFRASVAEAEALARSEEFDPCQLLGEHYAGVRRWTPAFLTTFAFQGVPAAASLLRAIDMLRDMVRRRGPACRNRSDRFRSRTVGATCPARRRYRPAGPRRSNHVAQHVDGPQKRGCGRHALEGEGRQKRPVSSAAHSIVLAQQLAGIELLERASASASANARAEAIPRDNRRDRVKGILLDLASRDRAAPTRA